MRCSCQMTGWGDSRDDRADWTTMGQSLFNIIFGGQALGVEVPLFGYLTGNSDLGRGRDLLASDQIVVGFPGANAVDRAVFDEQFGGSEPAVVVARHDKTVRAGDFEDQQIPNLGHWELPFGDEASFFLGKDVTAFAQGPTDDDLDKIFVRWLVTSMADGDRVVGTVEDRARQVVETCIEQIKSILAHLFDRADFGDQEAALGDEVPARFDFQTEWMSEHRGESVAGLVP